MINIELADQLPNDAVFKSLQQKDYPALFLGFQILTEYDNQRLSIDAKYNPVKITHHCGKSLCYLYGIKLTPNYHIESVFNIIKQQVKQQNLNLSVYENVLNQFGMSCKDTYRSFNPGLYPIDLDNLKKVCNDSFNTDKKIFQHLLCIDETSFDFQKFASLKLFILTK